MAGESIARDPLLTGNRRHRRIGYRLQMSRPFRHDEDTDLIDGEYRDSEGELVGALFTDETRSGEVRALLVIPPEEIPLMHVEAAFEGDHRLTSYEQVVALVYRADEQPAPGVSQLGDRWEDGEWLIYTFESDDEALTAQQYTLG